MTSAIHMTDAGNDKSTGGDDMMLLWRRGDETERWGRRRGGRGQPWLQSTRHVTHNTSERAEADCDRRAASENGLMAAAMDQLGTEGL